MISYSMSQASAFYIGVIQWLRTSPFRILGRMRGRVRKRDKCMKEDNAFVRWQFRVLIWKDKHLSLQTKARILNAMTSPVTLYCCEIWTKTAKMDKRIDASEMGKWRRTLGVS